MRLGTVGWTSRGKHKVTAIHLVHDGSAITREQDASRPLTVLFTSVGNQAFSTASFAMKTNSFQVIFSICSDQVVRKLCGGGGEEGHSVQHRP